VIIWAAKMAQDQLGMTSQTMQGQKIEDHRCWKMAKHQLAYLNEL